MDISNYTRKENEWAWVGPELTGHIIHLEKEKTNTPVGPVALHPADFMVVLMQIKLYRDPPTVDHSSWLN